MTVEEVYRYPADYDLEVEAQETNDLPFWIDVLKREKPKQVLEIGCGTGRLTIPLAREGATSGFAVTGVDVEQVMLTRAQERVATESHAIYKAVRFMAGDICSLELDEQFDVIMMPYGVAHHLTNLDDQQVAWENVRKHLVPGGLFAVDLVAPDLPLLARAIDGVPRSVDLDIHSRDGRRLQRSAAITYTPQSQIAKFAYMYDITDADGTQRHYASPFAMHIYYPHELEFLFRLTGFRSERLIGSYTGEPFTGSSPNMIALARNRGKK